MLDVGAPHTLLSFSTSARLSPPSASELAKSGALGTCGPQYPPSYHVAAHSSTIGTHTWWY